MHTGSRTLVLAVAAGLLAPVWLMAGCGDDRPTDGVSIQDGSLRGELAIYMSDDSDGRSDSRYALRAPSGLERTLLFDGDTAALVPGSELKVWGTETPQGVRVSSYRVVSPPIVERTSALQAGSALPDRAFAFVLLDLGGGVNVTSDTVMNRMINDPNSIRNYFLYDSYGRQNITAQVFGPIAATLNACDTSTLTTSLRPMITGTFQHYLWYLGSKQSACSWSGLASVGTAAKPSRDTWYNASTGCVVLVQEPGHNFGMQHSSSIRCTGGSLADDTTTCTASEYGDPFDPMGSGCRHMNAWQKAYQGWFGGCNGVNVTSSGTFTLLPFEMRCDGAQFLKIKAPKTRSIMRSGGGGQPTTETLDFYYLELRTGLDFDGTLGGGTGLTPRVLLHIANDVKDSTQRAIHPYIIDMTPNTASFNDAAFAVGQTFTDPAGGLSITATSISATQATITVNIPGGVGAPTCLDATTFSAPGPGSEVCVANTATASTGAVAGGTGGAGAGGAAQGAGGRVGTGGAGGQSPGSGGAAATGGATGTGTGGRGAGGAISTGGITGSSATGGATTGADGGGLTGANGGATAGGGPVGARTGGAPGPTGPGVNGAQDVVGGCACSFGPQPAAPANLFAAGGGLVLALGLARRRRRPVRRGVESSRQADPWLS